MQNSPCARSRKLCNYCALRGMQTRATRWIRHGFLRHAISSCTLSQHAPVTKGLGEQKLHVLLPSVSTASRPTTRSHVKHGFNTQPPEGGWIQIDHWVYPVVVLTHSRPKAAGAARPLVDVAVNQFQHTTARRRLGIAFAADSAEPQSVSTHNRPKAAGCLIYQFNGDTVVSTHNRPKAAGFGAWRIVIGGSCFNTQPPEGGWIHPSPVFAAVAQFQHTTARRRLVATARCPIW